jgi:hypothetical protein
MKEQNDVINFEIRSEAVRKIIGEVPPKVSYVGYSIFLIVMSILLLLGFFFKAPYHINSKVKIAFSENLPIGILYVPFDDCSKLDLGNKVFVKLVGTNNRTFISSIEGLPTEINPSNNYCYFELQDSVLLDLGIKFHRQDTITGNATIVTKQYSLFHRLLNSYRLKARH